jgi:P4 family phage/plasmid primase-like protien
MTTIHEILESRFSVSAFFTHVSIYNPSGKFQLDRKAQEDLFTLLEENIDTNLKIGISEKPTNYSPLMADIDIKTNIPCKDNVKRLYGENDVVEIIKLYQTLIKNIIPHIMDEELTCVLLEKSPYVDSVYNNMQTVKHGFHLSFPGIFLHQSVHKVQIIPQLRLMFDEHKFDSEFISSESIDAAYCTNAWLMYGASKAENKEPYRVTKIFNHAVEEVSGELAFKNYKIYDRNDKPIPITNARRQMARILSIIPNGRKTFEVVNTRPVAISAHLNIKSFKESRDNKTIEQQLHTARNLLQLLSKNRSENHTDWMTIGWVLYNISEGSLEGLYAWMDFSKKCPEKYNETKLIYEWSKMVVKDYTIGTIRYFAKIDSPDKYSEYNKNQVKLEAQKLTRFSHTQLARILHAAFSSTIVCASLSPHETWYIFYDNIWNQMERGHALMSEISTYLTDIFMKVKTEMYSALTELSALGNDMKAEEQNMSKSLKEIGTLLYNLESRPFKKNILGECSELFYDKHFYNKLNSDPYLFAFKNGVLNLKTNEFRAGKPEDFISKCAMVNYDTSYTNDNPLVCRMQHYLSTVFVDNDIRRYFMDYTSEIFVGGNQDKIFMIFSGEVGNNAKSMTINFLQNIFGIGREGYYVNMPVSTLTGSRSKTGAASPELARCGDGVRLVVSQEPGDSDRELNTGIIKELTGNDTFYARFLNENGRDVTPMFKIIMVCNKPPKIVNIEPAVRERVRVLPFESRFVKREDAPITLEEQYKEKLFPIDPYYGDNIKELTEAFTWMLVQHRINKKSRQIIVPEKVRIASELYSNRNDIMQQFLDETLDDDDCGKVALSELYKLYKEFIRESCASRKIPEKNDFKDIVCQYIGPINKNYWYRYKIRKLIDE